MTKIANEEIEAVARKMCVELGIDPDAEIYHGGSDPTIMTPAELEDHRARGGMTFDVAIKGHQWMLYRHAAAVAIAGSRVVGTGV